MFFECVWSYYRLLWSLVTRCRHRFTVGVQAFQWHWRCSPHSRVWNELPRRHVCNAPSLQVFNSCLKSHHFNTL